MSQCEAVLAAIVLGEPLTPDATLHVETCTRCLAEVGDARALGARLAAYEVPAPPRDLTAQVLAAARPALADRRRPPWSRLAGAVAASLAPLPAIAALDAGLLLGLYRLLGLVLPAAVAVYLVASYGLLLALGLTVGYAVVPVLAAREVHG